MPTIEELAAKYGGGTTASQDSGNIDDLIAKYTSKTEDKKPVKAETGGVMKDLERGMRDVSDTLDTVLQPTVGRLLGMEPTAEKRKQRLQEYEAENGTEPNLGRLGGQLLATAPILPARVLQGIRGAMGALPIALSTGEKVAAPLMNRLGAATATGALGGTAFGLGTSGVSQNSLPVHVGENALGGAVGGPLLDRASALASKVIPGIKSMTGDASINLVANRYGINPKAAKQILTELDNEGMTLAEAEAQINKLGPDATIADLTPGLQKMAGALAQRGGRATSIVENRFAGRADTANDSAHNIMVSNLGAKPNLETEKSSIVNEARRLTRPDYKAAYDSGTPLDVSNVVSGIDSALETAVGSKASQLRQAKSFLFKDGTLKNDIASLHEVRQALDDKIEKLGSPVNTQGSRTLGAINKIRDELDSVLKTNPQMQAADSKFAERMSVAQGLDIGSKALNKGNYEEFERTFNAASPELKETIKKGMRSQIGDMMEAAARGELAGAQQLLGKKSANRKKLELAFGTKGTDVLEALSDQAALRSTEKTVSQGSRTAINQRINALFDADRPKGILSDALTGLALDATSGSLGAGTAIMAAKRTGGNIFAKIGERRKDAFAESTADLISRNRTQMPVTMDALNTIQKIQAKLQPKSLPRQLSLPVNASSIVGIPVVDYTSGRIKDYMK